MAVLFAMLAALNWGSSAIFVRLGFVRTKPAPGTFFTMAVSTVMILVVALVLDLDALAAIPAVAIGWLALLGALNYLFGRFLNFWSVTLAGAARATPVVAVSPLFSLLFAVAVAEERVTPPILVGTVLIVLGLVLVISESFGRADKTESR